MFAGEHFAVYIVLPLHPPGDPASAQNQEILHWQTQTIDMMCKMVGKALDKRGPDGAKVTDYLNFYTLCNTAPTPNMGQQSTPAIVNIKGTVMIIDDEYLFLSGGSLTQRSLSGKRNTELGIGAWETGHTQESLRDKPHLQVSRFIEKLCRLR